MAPSNTTGLISVNQPRFSFVLDVRKANEISSRLVPGVRSNPEAFNFVEQIYTRHNPKRRRLQLVSLD